MNCPICYEEVEQRGEYYLCIGCLQVFQREGDELFDAKDIPSFFEKYKEPEQWSSEINLKDEFFLNLLEEKIQPLFKIREVLFPDAENIEEFGIRESLSSSEVRDILEEREKTHSPILFPSIGDLKAETILKATIRLCKKIYNRYLPEIEGQDITDFFWIVDKPFLYKDLYPGDTAIYFQIATRRKLVYIGE